MKATKKEIRNELRNESIRVMLSAFIAQCENDDELIELCVELEQVIDAIKQYINKKHENDVIF